MGMTVQSNECYDGDQYKMVWKHKGGASNSAVGPEYTIKEVLSKTVRKR